MIRYKNTETIQADDFCHIHVIPAGNRQLLNKTYPCSGLDMEESWQGNLIDQHKYVIIPSEELLAPALSEQHSILRGYLRERYW